MRPVAQPRNEGVDMNPKKSFAHQKAQAMIRSYHRNPKKIVLRKISFAFCSKHVMKFLLDRFEEQSNVPIREVYERVQVMTRGAEYLIPVVI